MKRSSPIVPLIAIALLGAPVSGLFAELEREQLALETQIQNRIESILSKTMPANSYLVTVKVEMDTNARRRSVRTTGGGTNRRNPFQQGSEFVLPGVPQRKDFVMQESQAPTETVLNAFEAETLVRRILITILVAPDVEADQIRALRDVLQGSIPFNPFRGDELDIQNSSLLKPINAAKPGSRNASSMSNAAPTAASSGSAFLDRYNAPVMALLGAALTAFLIFIAFLFGPVRSFLNRLLAVLPRVGEQAAYAVSNAPARPGSPGSVLGDVRVNGNGHVGTRENGTPLPFDFIQEEQLNKLPILLRQMTPTQTAIVLAYLKPEWASRMLASLEMGIQTAVMKELAQAREVPAEVVKDVESVVREKLPYLVGGTDWIQSVYQLTHPQTQRALLGTLAQQSPELAQDLRRKTFFYEDLGTLPAGALRLMVAETGYPVIASAMKDEKPEFRNAILGRLPAATREIILQELELSKDDKAASTDAKIKLVAAGRKLLAEGRIQLPERK